MSIAIFTLLIKKNWFIERLKFLKLKLLMHPGEQCGASHRIVVM
jgi:hypothetical protein